MVTPMPPQPQGPGAIPVLLFAELKGLREKHSISIATISGLEPGEQEAIQNLANMGFPIRTIERTDQTGRARWERRWRLASQWLRGEYPWRTVWFWEPKFQQLLDDWLANEDFDLVLVEDNAMGVYQYGTRTAVVFTEHEVRKPRPIDWRGAWRHPLRWVLREADWRRWPAYQSKVWQKFRCIQVFTVRDAATMKTMFPELADQICVNPFGVDLPPLINPIGEQNNQLLFVGNFTHPPNVDAALWMGREIMPLLRAQCPSVKLTLVGIYPPQEILDMAGEDILVTGAVPQIEPYLEQASVVVAPIRQGGGMRMKVLQSMAYGKAVVTTPRGAEGLEIGGYLPPIKVATSSQDFSQTIVQLLQNPQDRVALGQQARTYVEEYYTAQAYAARIEYTYANFFSEFHSSGDQHAN